MKNSIFWQFSIAVPLAIAGVTATTSGNYVFAQLDTDNSLGAESSIVTPQQLRDLIQGGAIRGNALFHSFDEFNVGDGGSVFFDLQNNVDILNIFTRVTGGNVSNILGTLGVLQDALNSNVLGNANLFLLNPNGITFGANANLQLNGSFFATTADGFGFDNFTFSASGEEAPPPLLTISIPRFASFRDNPGDIAVNQGNLTVNQGQSLSLVGGNVNVSQGSLNAPGGRIELGGLTAAGTVNLNPDFSLVFPDGVARGDTSLTNGTSIDVRSDGDGLVNLNARDINISGGSLIFAGIGANSGIPGAQAGDVTLDATREITITGASGVENRVNAGATGDSGNIVVNGGSLDITNGGLFSASTFGNGDAGDIIVNVDGAVTIDGIAVDESGNITSYSRIASGIASPGNFEGGDITINAGSLSLLNGGLINTQIFGGGNGQGGNVNINVTGNVVIDGVDGFGNSTRILSSVGAGAEGIGGNVTISGQSFSITGGGRINASTSGVGNAGSVTIDASTVSLDNSNIRARVQTDAQGDGGSVSLTTDSLDLTNGSSIDTTTFGIGNAGITTINASTITFNDSEIFAQVAAGAQGAGGNINITTDSLDLTNGGGINASIFGEGDAGNITVNATDTISVDGVGVNGFSSLIAANVQGEAVGSAGDIEINTGSLSLTNGGFIGSNLNDTSQGNGGVISINANTIIADGEGTNGVNSGFDAQVAAGAIGTGGSINITTDSLELTNGSVINVTTRGVGDAGDITINASTITFDDSDIFAQVATGAQGAGGSINIITDSLELNNGASINSITFGTGNAGNIDVTATDTITLDGVDNNNRFASAIVANVQGEAVGNAGNIDVTANSLSLTNGGFIASNTFSQGNAGNIKVTVTDTINIEGIGSNGSTSAIVSDVIEGATGNAGTIKIDPEAVIIRDGGEITVTNQGEGLGGNIFITSNTLTLDDGRISANTTNGGNGNITLNISDYILLLNGDGTLDASGNSLALISADSDGDGGNINLNTTALIAIPGQDSDITANSTGENTQGGQVTINSEVVLGIQASDNDLPGRNDITANSQSGNAGTVTITTPQTNPQQEDIEPPEEVTDETDVVAQSACNIGPGSQFANTGRGGIPQIPGFIIRNDVVDIDLVDEVLPAPPPEAIKPHHRTTVTYLNSEGEETKPAMGAVLLPNGMVEFVDYNPAEVYRDMYASAGCNKSSNE